MGHMSSTYFKNASWQWYPSDLRQRLSNAYFSDFPLLAINEKSVVAVHGVRREIVAQSNTNIGSVQFYEPTKSIFFLSGKYALCT